MLLANSELHDKKYLQATQVQARDQRPAETLLLLRNSARCACAVHDAARPSTLHVISRLLDYYVRLAFTSLVSLYDVALTLAIVDQFKMLRMPIL